MARRTEALLVGIGAIVIALGSLTAMSIAVLDALAVSALPGATTTTGEVVDVRRDLRSTGLRVSAGDPTAFCSPVVEATIEGSTVQVSSDDVTAVSYCTDTPSTMTVAYDPGDPDGARLLSPVVAREHWTVAGLAAIGVALGAFGVWIVRRRPQWLEVGARR